MKHASNARSDDLERAIHSSTHRYTNGNHRTEIKDTQRAFDPTQETCKHCLLSVRCFGQQVDLTWALENKCGCVTQKTRIEFYYHESLCLTYECPQNRITDHNMWGYSVTTSRSIGWYLDALVDHGFINEEQPAELKRLFKQRSSSEWVYL